MIDLKAKPFYLTDEDIEWVYQTLGGMTQEEKIGQLFCLILRDDSDEEIDRIVNRYKAGGYMFRPLPAAAVKSLADKTQAMAKIPLLLAANLERGGNGLASDATGFGPNMQVAATDDPEQARRLGEICGREAAALGGNWSFAPVTDIDFNPQNPICNLRTFGSDPQRVVTMSREYMHAIQDEGVAACIKHFPGDGVDSRDHHLVNSINTLSCEQWDQTNGMVYKTLIDEGALSLMVGHISLPAYSKKLRADIADADILPASLAEELLGDLLREQLGFNGLIVTDATTMLGFNSPMPREKSVPYSIAAGADMFLFTANLDEDYDFMRQGVEQGLITPQRLDEAITRILALKAALKLHKPEQRSIPSLDVVGCQQHRDWAKECADKAITLVKSIEPGVLPLSPEKHRRILIYGLGGGANYMVHSDADPMADFIARLEREGFEVEIHKPTNSFEGLIRPSREMTAKYDLLLYFANLTTKSNQTIVRIEWSMPFGGNAPHYVNLIPTVFISVANPYHLQDVPRIKTFINAYSAEDAVLDALVDKLMGRSEFKGNSPVDAFCGLWDTHL